MISECFIINNREYTFVTFYGNRSLFQSCLAIHLLYVRGLIVQLFSVGE